MRGSTNRRILLANLLAGGSSSFLPSLRRKNHVEKTRLTAWREVICYELRLAQWILEKLNYYDNSDVNCNRQGDREIKAGSFIDAYFLPSREASLDRNRGSRNRAVPTALDEVCYNKLVHNVN